MKIKVRVHASSSQERIVRIGDKSYEVWTREKPVDGKANLKLVKMLKKHFKKDVEIKSGSNSKNKIIELK